MRVALAAALTIAVAPTASAQTPDDDPASGDAPAEVVPAPPSESDDAPDEPAIDARAQALRVLASTDGAPARVFPFWQSDDGTAFIKPVLQLSSSVVGYAPTSETADGLAPRASTLALARFGLEGTLFGMLTFRSVFERNVGFSLGRNGPVGTSVWEGTGSFQARENYLRLHYEGFSVTGGIFRDPATVDFVSANILDNLGMDPYVRDPLLLTGFSQGQGVMLRYRYAFADDTMAFGASASVSAGNPLTSSLAFSFGGSVSALGTLFSAPLRALSSGIPGSDIQMYVVTPSVFFESPWFDLRSSVQVYEVDTDVTMGEDRPIGGWNFRSTAQVKITEYVRLYGTVSYRENQQLAVPDLTQRLDESFTGLAIGSGFDFTYDIFSIGGNHYYSRTDTGMNPLNVHYINVGATLWLVPPHVSLGVRWARSMASRNEEFTPPRLTATDSFILNLRLLI